MTKNGPIPKPKTDSESGECTDHFSTLQNNANLQCPVKNHPTNHPTILLDILGLANLN